MEVIVLDNLLISSVLFSWSYNSFEFSDWRFNLRMSNTEPLVRLNVESRGDEKLMNDKTEEILDLIKNLS